MPDPLARIEQQLIDAVPRASRRRRRRRAIAPAIAVIALLAASSAASAVTGVGPLADLLSSRAGDLDPRPGAPHVELTLAGPGEGRSAMRAFKNPGEPYCVQVPPVRTAATTSATCTPDAGVAKALADAGMLATVGPPAVPSSDHPDAYVIAGLVRGDAASISIADATGRTGAAKLSHVWTTAGEDLPLRAFLVVIDGAYPHTGAPASVRVVLEDGTAVRSEWPPPEG
jgi:hypothetical protein